MYIVHFEGNKNDEICDLLIGADGSNSTMRHQLLPEVLPSYAGYVAWRGVVDENEVPSIVLDFLALLI